MIAKVILRQLKLDTLIVFRKNSPSPRIIFQNFSLLQSLKQNPVPNLTYKKNLM